MSTVFSQMSWLLSCTTKCSLNSPVFCELIQQNNCDFEPPHKLEEVYEKRVWLTSQYRKVKQEFKIGFRSEKTTAAHLYSFCFEQEFQNLDSFQQSNASIAKKEKV